MTPSSCDYIRAFEDLNLVTLRNFQRLFGRVRSTAESLSELEATHV